MEGQSGFPLNGFGDNRLIFAGLHKGFYSIAEPAGDTDKALGAMMDVQKRDDVRGKSAVVNDEYISGQSGNGPHGNDKFGGGAGVKMDVGDNFVQHIEKQEHSGRRDAVVLIAMPAKCVAQFGRIGQPKARTIGR